MEPGQDSWRLGRRPVLDGIRGIAVLMVVLDHLRIDGVISPGSVGVTVFFTLSGFLITSLMLEEVEAAGRLNVRAFYIRRALRLLPALIVFLAVMLVAGWLLGPQVATPMDVLLALSYVGNWFSASGVDLHAVTHTWSLAVEEQFYIVWPAVFILLSRARNVRRAVLWFTGLGALGFAAVRLVEWGGGPGEHWVYFATEARADALLLGCFTAAWLHRSPDRVSNPRIATAIVVATVPLFFTGGPGRAVLLPTVAPLLTVALLLSVVGNDYSGWLNARWLRWVGQRSYALYLWNLPVLTIGMALMPGLPGVNALLPLVVCFGVTALSWTYVERPFQRLRHTLKAARPRAPEVVSSPAVVQPS